MKRLTSKTLFIAATLLIALFVTYLGYRAIAHEVLLRHYQTQALAQSRVLQVSRAIEEILMQQTVRLSSMIDFIQLDSKSLKTVTDRDPEIEAVIVFQKNHLLFPLILADEEQAHNEVEWIERIRPLVDDPSLLYAPYSDEETTQPQAGWFIQYNGAEPLLLYWQVKEQQVIAFKIPYVQLLSAVINHLTVDYAPDVISVIENERILYQNGNSQSMKPNQLVYTYMLDYPLNHWKIDYYMQTSDSIAIYLWGGLFICVLVVVISLVMWLFYREYTRTVRLAQQQVSFVSQVSHELKTPLTNITLYTEMLKEEMAEDEGQAINYAEVILSESQRLSRLIQNILSFTRIPKTHIQPVNINQLVSHIYHSFLPAFHTKGIELTLNLTDEVMIATDIDRLTQIIGNFLSNAEKYASSGKRVDLNVVPQKEWVEIQVRDYGKGITAKELKQIFQPFYRVNCGITEGVSGTGIGLTIAQQLAANLHGEILVEPQNPGILFSLRLPRVLPTQGDSP